MTTSPNAPDAEALYVQLRQGVLSLLKPGAAVVGIVSGGAWLSERLQTDLTGSLPDLVFGNITSTLHRDDFSSRGLAGAGAGGTQLPFDVNGRHIVLVDDVLHTGRTIRAVLNELYDYGRPARVQLAVLIDREGRELPVAADFAALHMALPAQERLALERDDAAGLQFQLRPARESN